MNILIIALSGIGDALMFTPALQKLGDELPDASIDVLVMYQGVKDIYENLPQISRVLYFDFLNSSKLESLRFTLSLRKKYNATINVYPSNRREYNLISKLIGADKRIAVKYLRQDFVNFGFLNTTRVLEDDNLHNVEENSRMVERLTGKKINEMPAMQFCLKNENTDFSNDFFKNHSIAENDVVIGFHPGCSSLKNHDKRRWEPEKFAALGKRLIEQFGAKILVFGGNDEAALKDSVIAGINSPNAFQVNVASLSNTAAVMKRCDLFITNDSSLMHVAAALKLSVIAIIGPTNVNYIHPWKTDFQIATLNLECSPCFHYSPKPLGCTRNDVKFKCIKELSVDQVFEKAAAQIKNPRHS
jgi:heptosyltransferase II